MTTLFLILAGFAAGFVDAVAGGGGLISLPALLATGLPPHLALGTNKAIGVSTALASSSRYIRARAVSGSAIGAWVMAAGILSVLGAFLATLLPAAILRPLILAGLIAVGLYLVRRRNFGLESKGPRYLHPVLLFLLFGSIGFYDGFFGPGTGTFLMMACVVFLGNDLLHASANARVINLSSNLAAILLFTARGCVDYRMVIPASLAAFVGGLLGASWALRHGSRAIRPVFLVVTWLLIAKVAYDLWAEHFFSGQ